MNRLRAGMTRLLPRSGIARSVGVLVSGTAAGQAIAVISSPILTRIYTPADLGTLGLYASVLGLLTIVASLRYEQAIAIPEDPKDASSVVLLAALLLCATTVVLFLAAWLVVPVISLPPAWSGVRPLAWLLPLSVFAVGLYQLLSVWAVRSKQYRRLAGTAWRQGLAGAVTQVLLGLAGLGATGLVIGQVVGQSTGVASLARLLTTSHGFRVSPTKRRAIWESATRFRRFPLYSTWSGLLSVASNSVPVALIAILFGPAVTGFYTIGLRALQTPMRTLGNAVSQVFLSESPQAAREGRLDAIVLPALSRLAAVASPLAAVSALSWAPIAQVVFGPEWREAGIYMQWLTPWVFLTMITAPLAPLFTTLERQDAGLYFNAALLAVRVTALLVGNLLGGVYLAIALFGAASFLIQWAMLEWLAGAAGVPRSRVRLAVGSKLLVALPLALPLLGLRLLEDQSLSDAASILYTVVAVLYFGLKGLARRRAAVR